MELAIDTSTRYATVGLCKDGDLLAELAWRSERNHSVELMPAIDLLLRRAGYKASAIDAIYVAAGPGGFSALRVGMSAAKAIASALGAPLAAVGTLDVEAQPYIGLGKPVCALVGAGRTRLYVGRFAAGEPAAYEVVERTGLTAVAAADAVFCGEAAAEMADDIRASSGVGAAIAAVAPPTRRAGTLGALGYEMLRQGQTADVDSVEPLYLRSSQLANADRARARRAG